jgi:hypothetical protein
MVFFASMVIVCGPPASIAGSFASHFPSLPALVLTVLPLKVMLMLSFLSAQPHTLISLFL